MKNSIKYISAAALMLAMAACQSEEDFTSAYESDTDAVKINATIAGMAPQSRVNTDGDGDTWQDDDLIKVNNTSINGKNEGVYKYGESKWSPQGSGYMVWADGENTFQAFYPYAADKNNSFTEFEIPNNQANLTLLSKADWMTATVTTAKTNDKAVNLTFKHELVKVTMKIVKYNDQYSSSEILIYSNSFYVPTSPTKIEDKTVTVEGTDKIVTGHLLYAPNYLYSIVAILPPGKFSAGDTVFKLVPNQQELFVKVPANSILTTSGLESGKAYTFELTIGKNEATIGNVTVNDWGASDWSGVGTGGTAEEDID